MPPKKTKSTPGKAAAAEPAASITSGRGQKIAATAATDRPRRVSSSTKPSDAGKDAPATASAGRQRRVPTSAKLSAPAKSAPAISSTPNFKKKRGRPAKSAIDEPPKKRVRGSGGKAAVSEDVTDKGEEVETEEEAGEEEAEEDSPSPKARRSTQAKQASAKSKRTQDRGRKGSSAAEASTGAPPPKRRGRPPKGGETTQITADAQAAAEQLEDELQVEQRVAKPSKGRKGRPSTKEKGKAPKIDEDVEEGAVGEDDVVEEESSGQHYWLMKAEQEDRMETLKSGREFNTKFTIDDLRSKTVPEPWDGVRNAVAAKNMRNMTKGDLAFFYASGGKSGRKPGITGIMEIVKEHEPDVTTADEDAYGYVEKESDRARWCAVHVEFRKKLTKPVSLKELQKYSEANGVLAKMQVLNSARLSVTAVSEKEWNFIVNSLIDGYEDDDEAPTREVEDGDDAHNNIEVRVEVPTAASATARGRIKMNDESKTDAKIPAEVSSAQREDFIVPKAKPSSRSASAQDEKSGSCRDSGRASRRSSRQNSRQAPREASQPVPSGFSYVTSDRPPSRGRSRTRRSRTMSDSVSAMTSVQKGVGADNA